MILNEAAEKVNGFFKTYPVSLDWHKRYNAMAHKDGYVVSPVGRIRHLPHIHGPDGFARSKAERQSINSPVRATLSDMMVWAVAEIDRQHPEYAPVAMIHDAGIFYVPEERADEAAKNIRVIMGNLPIRETFGWDHSIPFPADASLGPDLGHMAEWHPLSVI